jgi:hypothetical protein
MNQRGGGSSGGGVAEDHGIDVIGSFDLDRPR